MLSVKHSRALHYAGLIITQSGQAYYVNEKGVPIAQGVAPPSLSESLIPKSSIAASSAAVTSTTPSPCSSESPDQNVLLHHYRNSFYYPSNL